LAIILRKGRPAGCTFLTAQRSAIDGLGPEPGTPPNLFLDLGMARVGRPLV